MSSEWHAMLDAPKPGWPLVSLLLLVLPLGLTGCHKSVESEDARAASSVAPPAPRYFEAIWPPENGAPGVHYRVPVEYMVNGSVYGTAHQISSFMVCFEMPGARPCRQLPQIDDPRERKAAHAVLRERYRVVQITREVGGYEKRMRVRDRMRQGYGGPYGHGLYRSYDVAGLEQYSVGTCYSPVELQTVEVRKILAERRDAAEALPNCNLSTLGEYVSPPSVTGDNGGYTYCMSTSCRFHFSIQGRQANFEFSSRGRDLMRHGLEHWREIIIPAKKVIKQWIAE